MNSPSNPTIACYLTIQSRLETLARRWVTAYEGTFQGYSANYVKLSYDAEGKGTISFSYRHCDGIALGYNGTQIPATYLDDDSTLEADAKAAKQAIYDKWAAEQKETDLLRCDPAVQKYLAAESRRGYSMQRYNPYFC